MQVSRGIVCKLNMCRKKWKCHLKSSCVEFTSLCEPELQATICGTVMQRYMYTKTAHWIWNEISVNLMRVCVCWWFFLVQTDSRSRRCIICMKNLKDCIPYACKHIQTCMNCFENLTHCLISCVKITCREHCFSERKALLPLASRGFIWKELSLTWLVEDLFQM